jgi:hypothetical protein
MISECCHNLVSVTHKVPDHHLHHEWQWLVCKLTGGTEELCTFPENRYTIQESCRHSIVSSTFWVTSWEFGRLILDDWRKLHNKISNYLWKRKVKLNMVDQLSKKGTGKRPNCLIASPSSSHKHPESVAQIQSKLQFQFDTANCGIAYSQMMFPHLSWLF